MGQGRGAGGAGQLGKSRETVDVGQPVARNPSGFQISQELFERADQALYATKQTGRNRVSVNRVSG